INSSFEKRTDPSLIMDDVKSVISLAYVYDTPIAHSEDKNIPKISRYAWGSRDYHKVLKKILKELCADIESLSPHIKTKFYVDDGPVMDKAWAVRSGVGWLGKNATIIDPDTGSFFFLSTILINQELEYGKPIDDLCKSCMLCVNECPTGAIYEEYKVDANLCISYHTIENRGAIPEEIDLDGWIFGCDVCQDVCPYNGKNIFTDNVNFYPRKVLTESTYSQLSDISEENFNLMFSGTPIKRTKYSGWIRNISQAEKKIKKV
ncbi:MAG: tRNA epoxyqueuosine(34) reductase QueG, partial [bacterium]